VVWLVFRVTRIFFIIVLGVAAFCGGLVAQTDALKELEGSSTEHMREELGVNPVTSPSIASLLKDLEAFRPVPMKTIEAANREASFSNRLQTALHFGSLVADGFMLTVAERPQDLQDIGRELIRQSRALGVGERLPSAARAFLN
jgi:hypothetical protein